MLTQGKRLASGPALPNDSTTQLDTQRQRCKLYTQKRTVMSSFVTYCSHLESLAMLLANFETEPIRSITDLMKLTRAKTYFTIWSFSGLIILKCTNYKE